MANDLHNLDDALAQLEELAVKTTQGTFVRMEDVKRLVKQRDDEREAEATSDEEKPATFAQAKEAIKGNKELMAQFPPQKRELGRAVPASEPQPPSRA
jgi:peptidoglycan hydrolase CwlO-like protein